MAFHIFLLAGSFFSLSLIEITNPYCNNELECPNNEFRSCCEGICNVWKYCNGTCVTDTDCDLHELCVDNMCAAALNTTKKPTTSHIRLKDYLICIGFVMGLFLFQLGLPLLYIYKDKVAFCLKCKWLWNKENIEEEQGPPLPQQVSRRWPLFGWSLGYPTAVQYSRLSQLDDSCSFESQIYTESRNPGQNLEIVQRQVENVFGVPPPVYTNQIAAGEATSDTSENISTSDSPQAESCSDQTDEPRPTNPETEEEIVHSESSVTDPGTNQETPNPEEINLSRAEQHFNLALSIPPPYERARFAPPDDDQTDDTGFYSPANELPDDLNVESSLKKLYKLPSYNSINKISEEAERLPPSYTEALED